MQGVQRYVIFSYLAIALLVWATLAKLLAAVAYAANLPDPAILGDRFTLTTVLGALVAATAAYLGLRNERAYQFSAEVITELRKVTWPARRETQAAVVVVLMTTFVVSMILGLFDWIWAGLTGIVYTS